MESLHSLTWLCNRCLAAATDDKSLRARVSVLWNLLKTGTTILASLKVPSKLP